MVTSSRDYQDALPKEGKRRAESRRVHLERGHRSALTFDETAKKTVVNMRLDTALLRRIDAAAKRQGITRTAWLSVAAARLLDE
jgi:predicted DNA binding CopG/RHH family protein